MQLDPVLSTLRTFSRIGALALLAPPSLAGGALTAAVDAQGNLVVTGDASSNVVRVHHDPATDLFHVTAEVGTVNGLPSVALLAPGPRVRIQLGAGNDRVLLGHELFSYIPRGVDMDLGEGDDSFGWGDQAIVSGNVTIQMGAGNDVFTVEDGVFGGKLLVSMGRGDDVVTINFSFFAPVGGVVRIDTGAGSDQVEVRHHSINGSTRFMLGPGDDEILFEDTDILNGELVLDGGAGKDQLTDPPLGAKATGFESR